jgi:hypothetical protein
LKRRVDARKPATLDELRIIVKEEWTSIPMEIIRNTILSMPERLLDVRESNGEVIDY